MYEPGGDLGWAARNCVNLVGIWYSSIPIEHLDMCEHGGDLELRMCAFFLINCTWVIMGEPGGDLACLHPFWTAISVNLVVIWNVHTLFEQR
jgi:hypothetical protein